MTGNVTDLLQAWIQEVLLMVKISIFLLLRQKKKDILSIR